MEQTTLILLLFAFLFNTAYGFLEAFENSAACSVEKRMCKIHEGNFISSMSAIEVEECRQLCFDLDNCKYFSHLGPDSYLIKNYCMLFSSCPVLGICKDCYTEDKLCYGSCGTNVESALEDNVIEFIPDTVLEHSCKTLCLDNAKCKVYTHFRKDDPNYPDLCALMTEFKAPFHECEHCVTSVPDCKNNPYDCKFTINNENTFYGSYMFNSSETTIKFPLASNLACQATFLAIGGGGYSYKEWLCGGGSGYIESVVIDISSTEYEVTVGRRGENSFVKNNDGMIIINALQGGNGYNTTGGPGYSGGGGRSSKGGSNGSNGQGDQAGQGSGIDISKIDLDHFVLSPSDGGEPISGPQSFGGGGGGILVDNFGPKTNFGPMATKNNGKGYGGGAGGLGGYGLPGMVLIEVKPK